MAITIKVADEHDPDAQRSLLNFLLASPDVLADTTISVGREKDPLGPEVEVIQLVVNSGIEFAKLVMAFLEWRKQSGETATVHVDAGTGALKTKLSPGDMEDEQAVRRALLGVPDPKKASGVLIGVGSYTPPLEWLPAVQQNLLQLESALADPKIWGIPRDRLRRLENPASAETIVNAVKTAARNANDTLLVYFAGHGLYSTHHELLLALPGASKDSAVSQKATVPWSQVAEVIKQSAATRRIVILDCCYGGLALPSGGTPPGLLESVQSQQTYTLVAAQNKDEHPKAVPGAECTEFTGELIQVLNNGIPSISSQEFITLDEIRQVVHDGLAAKNLGYAQPGCYDPGHIGHVPYFRNLAHEQNKPEPEPGSSDPPPGPGPEQKVGILKRISMLKLRTWQTLASAIIAAGLAAGIPLAMNQGSANAGSPGPASSLISRGGLDLSGYCAGQNRNAPSQETAQQELRVGGKEDNECTFPVNLSKACDWQYQKTGLILKLTDGNLDSGVCYGSQSNSYGGISNMAGYCQKITGNSSIGAKIEGGKWACWERINLDAACNSQYNSSNLQARKDSDGNLECYKP